MKVRNLIDPEKEKRKNFSPPERKGRKGDQIVVNILVANAADMVYLISFP